MRIARLLVVALFITACLDQKDLVRYFAPKEDDAVARQFLELVKAGQYPEATAMLDESSRAQAPDELWKMRVVLDKGEPVSFDLIESNIEFFKPWNEAQVRRVSLVYQLQFPTGWALAQVTVESSGERRQIQAARVQPLADSVQVLNAFTLQNKSILHYAVLAVCVAVPLFIIVTVATCIRSRVRRRWLWIIFILFGLGEFQLNWSIGAWALNPLAFSLLGSGFFRSGMFGPWILKTSLPLGAILFVLLRSRLRKKGDPPPLPSTPAPPTTPPSYDY